jgi:hypothetical protein
MFPTFCIVGSKWSACQRVAYQHTKAADATLLYFAHART